MLQGYGLVKGPTYRLQGLRLLRQGMCGWDECVEIRRMKAQSSRRMRDCTSLAPVKRYGYEGYNLHQYTPSSAHELSYAVFCISSSSFSGSTTGGSPGSRKYLRLRW